MRVIQVNSDTSARLSGAGCRTDRACAALDLPEFGAALRGMALRGEGRRGLDGWVCEPRATEPSIAELKGWGWKPGDQLPTCWRQLAIGVSDPGGVVVIWTGWWFMSYTPDHRATVALLNRDGLGRAYTPILDLFDLRVSRPERLSAARSSLVSLWTGSSTAVDRLGGLLLECRVEPK